MGKLTPAGRLFPALPPVPPFLPSRPSRPCCPSASPSPGSRVPQPPPDEPRLRRADRRRAARPRTRNSSRPTIRSRREEEPSSCRSRTSRSIPTINVLAELKPVDDTDDVDDADSTGTVPDDAPRRHAGVHAEGSAADAHRVHRGRRHSGLFVAFNDLTSGTETYAGGTVHRSPPNGTDIYELDFNRAYNPYCYYNPTYECPYPPPENRLKSRSTPARRSRRHASRPALRPRPKRGRNLAAAHVVGRLAQIEAIGEVHSIHAIEEIDHRLPLAPHEQIAQERPPPRHRHRLRRSTPRWPARGRRRRAARPPSSRRRREAPARSASCSRCRSRCRRPGRCGISARARAPAEHTAPLARVRTPGARA